MIFSLPLFFNILLISIIYGLIYSLMGMGLTMIFGIMKLTNFAHGDFYMLGSYFLFFLITMFNIPFYFAIPLSMATVFVLGVGCEVFLLRPVREIERSLEYALLITISLGTIIKKLVIILVGPYKYTPGDFVSFTIIGISGNEVIACVTAIIMIITVHTTIKKTSTGRFWRAMAEDKFIAKVVGVNINRNSSYAFGVSTMLAGVAGALIAPIFYVTPLNGNLALVKGYVIIAIGGLGSFIGSIFGGIALGITEGLGSAFYNPAYKDVYGFILMVIVLTMKSWLGERSEIFVEKVKNTMSFRWWLRH